MNMNIIVENSNNKRKFLVFENFFREILTEIYDKINLKTTKITYNDFANFAYLHSTVDYKLIDIYLRYL
jgi:hypothetical protein